MHYQHFDVEPLTPTIGGIVHGVDLTQPLDDATFDDIRAAWLDRQVLFFRNQPLTPERHLAFGRRFGELHIHPAAPYANGDPALMKIHTDKDSWRNNGSGWHSDVSADLEPPMASILHLHTVPSQGGDTLWASMYAAYDALSDTMKAFIDPLTAEHRADYTGYYGDHAPQRESPRAVHPVVRTHPETRRKALYVNRGFTTKINELARAESRALLDFLFAHATQEQFQCRFRWEQNSVAIWDNPCTQHMAIWDYFPETRSGIRVTVKGDRPFNANRHTPRQ
jgi:taurine dioxygenase